MRLDEPVDRLLPELAGRKVLKRFDDLLTFRMGFGIIMGPPDVYLIQKAVSEQQIMTLGPPKPPTPLAPDEWSRPPAFPDAGAGLVSTIDDYLAFGQMMRSPG